MKTYVNSASFGCLMIVLIFSFMGGLSFLANGQNLNASAPTGFFLVIAFVFLTILPACSTKK